MNSRRTDERSKPGAAQALTSGGFQILVEEEGDCLAVMPAGYIDRRSADILVEFVGLVHAAVGSNGYYVRCGRTTGVSAEAYELIVSHGLATTVLAAANRHAPR